MKKERSLLADKIIFTITICIYYVIGRLVPLFGVDTSAVGELKFDAQAFFTQTLSGDLKMISIFAVGIFPYMTAGIIVQIVNMFRNSDKKAKTSQRKLNIITVILTMIFAFQQADEIVMGLTFVYTGNMLYFARAVAYIQLVTGAAVILVMSEKNKKYGIGGQTIIIFVNIIDNLRASINRIGVDNLLIPLCLGLFTMFIMIFMDNSEKRIHMQRISINNAYDEQSYVAIKLNPVGSMPIMFAGTFCLIPQYAVKILLLIWPDDTGLIWFQENDMLTKPLGIAVYTVILYLITIFFAVAMVGPRDMAERMQKAGDSLVDIRPGKDTRKYLTSSVVRLALVSATVMALCTVTPMILQTWGYVDPAAIMFPTSIMILTGIWSGPYEEVRATQTLQSYKPFL